MRNTIKKLKELEEVIENDIKNEYRIKEAMSEVVKALIDSTVNKIIKNSEKMKDPNTPDEKKPGLGTSMNIAYSAAKPFEDKMRFMYPQHKALLDDRALKADKANKEFLEEWKKKQGKY
jgi:hypothetical protein